MKKKMNLSNKKLWSLGRFELAIYRFIVQSANQYTMGSEEFEAEIHKNDFALKT